MIFLKEFRFCRTALLVILTFFLIGGNYAFAKKEKPESVKKCVQCHKNYIDDWAPTKHGKIFMYNPRNALEKSGCDACHGDGTNHIADASRKAKIINGVVDSSLIKGFSKKSKLSTQQKNEICLQCHKKDKVIFDWRGSQHESAGMSCVDCHQYGKPSVKMVKQRKVTRKLSKRVGIVSEHCGTCHTQKRAQMQRTSHMPYREGKMTCSDCHNAHGGSGPSLLRNATVNETCYSCHQEKRGPFLWEHAPAREDCLNCHNSHGSNYAGLLKMKQPFLCQTCHMGVIHSSEIFDRSGLAGGTPNQISLGKGCTNCHSKVHGSNHPSGARLKR